MSRGAVLGLGIAGAFAIALPGGAASGNKYASETATRDCDDNDLVTFAGPLKLWPPNHKMIPVSVVADAGEDTENVVLTVTPVVTDVAGGDGGANHDPDYTPEKPAGTGTGKATVDLSLRAERSGNGTGRTYTLDWVAKFGDKTCTSDDEGPFVVTVPHDMRGGADWK